MANTVKVKHPSSGATMDIPAGDVGYWTNPQNGWIVVSNTPASPPTGGLSSSQSSPTPTTTHTLKAYDTNNNYAVVYVVPGQHVSGISLTPKSASSPASSSSTGSTPSVSDVKIPVYYKGFPGQKVMVPQSDLQDWLNNGYTEEITKLDKAKQMFWSGGSKIVNDLAEYNDIVSKGGVEGEAAWKQKLASEQEAKAINDNKQYGGILWRGDYALAKFSDDPDGDGPQSSSTVFLIDNTTKKLYPFLNQSALDNYFAKTGLDKSVINNINTSYLSDQNLLGNFELRPDSEGIDETLTSPSSPVDKNTILQRYGQKQDSELERKKLFEIEGLLDFLGSVPDSGFTKEFTDKIKNDSSHNIYKAFLVNANAYGGYSADALMKELKRKMLELGGDKNAASIKIIDQSVPASSYYNTEAGKNALNNSLLSLPQTIGGYDIGLFNNPIFNLPDELYKELVPTLDWNSPEIQAELDEIKTSYYDILIRQMEAKTEQDKAAADYEYGKWKTDIEKKLGIKLSDNANEAWNQLNSLGKEMVNRGIGQSGIADEIRNKYLGDIRKGDQRVRDDVMDAKEEKKREYYLNNASSEEIAALSEEEKIKYGLKPSAETLAYFSKENLKSLYPELSDTEIDMYINTVLDPTSGTYKSKLYQTLGLNTIEAQKEKREYQRGEVNYDPKTGNVIGGYGLLYKKALEAEEAYRQYEKAQPFSADTTNAPASTVAPTITPSTNAPYSVVAQNQNIVQPTTPQTSTPNPTPPTNAPYSVVARNQDVVTPEKTSGVMTPAPVAPINNKVKIKNLATQGIFETTLDDFNKSYDKTKWALA